MKKILLFTIMLCIMGGLKISAQEDGYIPSQSEIDLSDPAFSSFFKTSCSGGLKSTIDRNLVSYKQYDSQYAGQIGTSNCTSASCKMSVSGCIITCMAMMVSTDGVTKTPTDVQNDLKTDGFDGCCNMNKGFISIASKFSRNMKHYAFTYKPNDLSIFESCISKDKKGYILARVQGVSDPTADCHHTILIYDRKGLTSTIDDYLFADPGRSTPLTLDQSQSNHYRICTDNWKMHYYAPVGTTKAQSKGTVENTTFDQTITIIPVTKGNKVVFVAWFGTNKSTTTPCNVVWLLKDANGNKLGTSTENSYEITNLLTDPGKYYLTYAVKDADGFDAEVKEIVVSEPPVPELKADFTASTYSGATPLKVDFTPTVTGGASPYTYSWNFGDNTALSTTANVSHTFTTAKTYTISLTVTDANKVVKSVSHTVTAVTQDALYDAAFTMSPSSGKAPITVSFTDKSGGTPTAWKWDFGNTKTSTDQNPSYTFTVAKTYTIKLTVYYSDGSTSVSPAQSLVVSPLSYGINLTLTTPSPKIDQNYEYTVDSEIKLTNPTWTWAFSKYPNNYKDYNSPIVHFTKTINNSDKVTPTPYSKEGRYSVTISVLDDNGYYGQVTSDFNVYTGDQNIYPHIFYSTSKLNNYYYVALNSSVLLNQYTWSDKIVYIGNYSIRYDYLGRLKWSCNNIETIVDYPESTGCKFYIAKFTNKGINTVKLTSYVYDRNMNERNRNLNTDVSYNNSTSLEVFACDLNETKNYNQGDKIEGITGIINFNTENGRVPIIKSTETKNFDVVNYALLKNGFHAVKGSNVRITAHPIYKDTYTGSADEIACLNKSAIDTENINLNNTKTETTSINYNNTTIPSLYPNPTTGNLTITKPTQKANLQIINMYGVVVHSQHLTGTTNQINISQLVSGVYTVKLVSAVGVWQTQVVKN